MAYRIAVFVFLLVYSLAGYGNGTAQARPSLVFEVKSGRVLHSEQAGIPWHPASLTKLMTAYIVFGEIAAGRLKRNQKIRVSKAAMSAPPSKIGVPAGKMVTVLQAERAMAIRSANDMAVVLAEAVAGSQKAFVKKMNQTARRLGMTGTRFVNPHGLPEPEQITTARDMGILARAIILDFPKQSKVFGERYLKWGKKRLKNRNKLLGKLKGADGLKTGFICASGFNLVASATRRGKRLVSVFLGAPTASYRFAASARLLEKGFSQKFTSLRFRRKLTSLVNSGGRRAPANLRPDVCEKQRVATLTKAEKLKGWGILFGVYKSSKSAKRVLLNSMANLRGAVRGAQAAVLNSKAKNRHGAVLAGLNLKEAKFACDWLSRVGAKCVRISPRQMRRPLALLR